VVVGLAVWQLDLPGSSSLKEKRMVIKSLKDRLHNQYNVSVAETAHQDVHGRAELAACVVSGDQAHANSVLTAVDRFVEGEARVRIVDSYTTYY
jgi:uncharacterized protein YlxP (DUF503 family)